LTLPDNFKEKYDYRDTSYFGSNEIIYYICPYHGRVSMLANKHKNSKYGCNSCATELGAKNKKATAGISFIAKCKRLYGGQFDYSHIDYRDTKTNVKFICKDHGPLYEIPMYAQRYNPCKGCRDLVNVNINRKPEQQVRKESLDKFKVEFDFDFTNYINCNSIIGIKCPDHNWFDNKLSNHFNSLKGCPQCFIEWEDRPSTKISKEDNIKKLLDIYGDKYNFFTEDIDKSKSHVRYYCRKHHCLKSTALNHLKDGYACNQCGDEVMAEKLTGFYTFKSVEKNKDKYLKQRNNLYIFLLDTDVYKIGISTKPTNRNSSVKKAIGLPSKILTTWPLCTYDAFYLEQHIHSLIKDYRFDFGYTWNGHTEVFTLNYDDLEGVIQYIDYKVNYE